MNLDRNKSDRTGTEANVQNLLDTGVTDTKEIARQLGLSEGWIRQVVSKLLARHRVRSRTDLVYRLKSKTEVAEPDGFGTAEIFESVPEWAECRHPSPHPGPYHPDRLGEICWRDIEARDSYEAPQVTPIITRLKNEQAVLVMARPRRGLTTFGITMAARLEKLGWHTYWLLRGPHAGIGVERIVEEMTSSKGPRAYIFDRTDEHRRFHVELLQRLAGHNDPDLHVILLSRPYPRSPHLTDRGPQSPKDVLEPEYLDSSSSAIGLLLKDACQKEEIDLNPDQLARAEATYPSPWWANRAVAYVLGMGKPAFRATRLEEIGAWVTDRYFRPRLYGLLERRKQMFDETCALGSLDIAVNSLWWTHDEAGKDVAALVEVGLLRHWSRSGAAEPRMFMIGPADLCWEILCQLQHGGRREAIELQRRSLKALLISTPGPNVGLVFGRLAQRNRQLGVELLSDADVHAAVARKLVGSDVVSAVRSLEILGECSQEYASVLAGELGCERIAAQLANDAARGSDIAQCLESLHGLEPRSGGELADRLLNVYGSSIAPLQVRVERSLVAQVVRTGGIATIGFLLKAIAHSSPAHARLLLPLVKQRLLTAGSDSLPLDDLPLSSLLPVLRGVQLVDQDEAGRLCARLSNTNLAEKVAVVLGRGVLRQVCDVFWRIDPVFMSNVLSCIEDQLRNLSQVEGTSLGELAADLGAISEVAPPLAASLLDSIEDEALRDLLQETRDIRTLGRAIRQLAKANLVKTRTLLRNVGSKWLAQQAVECPLSHAVGQFLQALSRIDLPLARVVLASEDLSRSLPMKTAGAWRQLAGYATLLWGIASIDVAAADKLHEDSWGDLTGRISQRLQLEDLALGLHYLSFTKPDDAIDFLASQVYLMDTRILLGRPPLTILVSLLSALAACSRGDPARVSSLFEGKENWLASQANARSDIEVLGQYLYSLTETCPPAALLVLQDAAMWTDVLKRARDAAAIGKIAVLLRSIAHAERKLTAPSVLTKDNVNVLGELLGSVAAKVTAERRLTLARNVFNAIAPLWDAVPDLMEAFVAKVNVESLVNRAGSLGDCQTTASFLSALGRLSPGPDSLVQEFVSRLGVDFFARLISRERLVWRVVWLNRSLIALERRGSLLTGTTASVWISDDLNSSQVADRVIWEQRTHVGATLLRQLQSEISSVSALRLADELIKKIKTSSILSKRASSDSPASIAALLSALAQIIGNRAARTSSKDLGIQADELLKRSRSASEKAWIIEAVSPFFGSPPVARLKWTTPDTALDPFEAALLSTAINSRPALPANLRPTARTLATFLDNPDVDPFLKRISLRFWVVQLNEDARRHWAERLSEASVDEYGKTEDDWLQGDFLGVELGVSKLRSHWWEIYDHLWGQQPITWLESPGDLAEDYLENEADLISI